LPAALGKKSSLNAKVVDILTKRAWSICSAKQIAVVHAIARQRFVNGHDFTVE
jgi:hypothetical protein